MFTLKSEPQDKGHILQQSFDLYRQSFWSCLPYSLFAALFAFCPQLFLWLDFIEVDQHVSFVWVNVGALLGSLFFTSALIFRLYCACYQVPGGFLQSLRQAMLKFVPLILLALLYAILVLGSTMLLIIPGIYLSYALSFAFLLLITHNQRLLQTLVTSFRLIQTHWWHSFFILTTPLLFILSAALLIFMAISRLQVQGTFDIGNMCLTLFAANTLVQACLLPWLFATALVLLHDLRQRYFAKIPPW